MIKKNKHKLTTSDFYEKDFPKKKLLSKKEYNYIIRTFLAVLVEGMIQKGNIYRLPKMMGGIGIHVTNMGSKKLFDFAHYKKTKERVWRYLGNEDYKMASYRWFKNKHIARFPSTSTFQFKPVRSSKKQLAQYVKDNDALINYLQ